jgi:hypothetical protein
MYNLIFKRCARCFAKRESSNYYPFRSHQDHSHSVMCYDLCYLHARHWAGFNARDGYYISVHMQDRKVTSPPAQKAIINSGVRIRGNTVYLKTNLRASWKIYLFCSVLRCRNRILLPILEEVTINLKSKLSTPKLARQVTSSRHWRRLNPHTPIERA